MSSAMSCDRAIEVEDLVLGLVVGADAEALAAHVVSCADCTQARAMFAEERALFEARPAPPAPPALVLPKTGIERLLGPTARLYRFVPALAAVAACVAVFLGRLHAPDCEAPMPAVTSVAVVEEGAPLSGAGICRAPEHTAPVASFASHDTNACVPSPTATCDVTSSTAMP